MSVAEIPKEGWIWAVLVLLAVLNLYNVIASARRNYREEKRVSDEPIDRVSEQVKDNMRKLENDKRRLDEMEHKINDDHKGIMSLCVGVQALLEHELHDGNTEELTSASKGIRTWLQER